MKSRLTTRLAALATVMALVLLAVFGASCGSATFSKQPQARMEAALDKLMSDNNIPGAAVGVWAPGKGTWVVAKGKADLKTGRAMVTADNFRIGSTTKPFTATVALQLVDEGLLRLDDKLSLYKFPVAVPNAGGITVRQLLNHTSGLYDYADAPAFDSVYTTDPLHPWTTEELLKIGLSHAPYFAPGKGWHYSNTNYILLGVIAQDLTNHTIADEVRSRIIGKMGLKSTFYPSTPAMPAPYTRGYIITHGPSPLGPPGTYDRTLQSPSVAGASGAMISTLDDLHSFALALGRGDLVSQKSHKEQTTFVPTGNQQFTGYGLGMMQFGDLVGHGGDINGYSSNTSYSPSTGAVIVVLVNKDPNANASGQVGILLTKQLAKIVYPQMNFTGM